MPADSADPAAEVDGLAARHRGRDFRRGVVAALSLALFFTGIVVQWSFARGRLSQDPTYDDSAYLFEAGRRLAVLYEHGLSAYVVNLYRDPPHAPFIDLGAQLTFALVGLHAWAPYVFVNGAVIFVLLLAVAYFARSVSLGARIVLMTLCLTLPFVVVGLHEYRPDFAGALFTALGIGLVAEAALHRTGDRRDRQLAVGGIFFGLALVTKAVFFVHTLTMEALSVFAACALTWWEARGTGVAFRDSLRRFVGVAWRVGLPSLLIWAPYILVNFHETFGYFFDFALGKNSHVSEIKGGLAASVHFYTLGYAGEYMLGRAFFIGLALWLFCLGCMALTRNIKELLFQAVLLGCGTVSLASIIMNQRENHYFGVPADTLLLFMLLRGLVVAWRVLCTTPRRAAWAIAGLAVVCVVNLSLLRPEMLWPYANQQLNYVVKSDQSINQKLLDDIWQEYGTRAAIATVPPQVFVTRGGFVTAPTLRWLALKEGRRVAFTDVWTDEHLELTRRLLEAATFVVAPEDNAAGVYNENASYEMRFEIERLLAGTPGLRRLRRYPDSPGGPGFRLFVNDEKLLENAGSFSNFQAGEGFLPWEGPYPESKLGKVRWALAPRSVFTVPASAPTHATLRFSVRADQPVRGTLQLRGETLLKLDLPHLPTFQNFSVPVNLQAGANEFVFQCENELFKAPDGYRRAMLFRQLEVATPDGREP